MSRAIQISLAVVILGCVAYFYWYSRNYVAGYYELSWFGGDSIWVGSASKWLFVIPVAAVAGYAIYYKLRGQNR